LKHRKYAPLIIAAALILTVACFRGGTDSGGSTAIPFFTPTVVPQVCENDGYPSDAPQFGDDSGFEYVVTESGLSVFDRIEGTGASPDPTDDVLVHYTGFLTDGCIFDTSRTRSGPTPFTLTQLIPGMQEGITGMRLGGSRRIKIPPGLAYQTAGFPGRIPPNSTIIFEVELIEINRGDDDESPAEDTVEEPTQTTSGN
jgi:hypothetical protein